MKFDPVAFTLHDGRECTLRSAEPEDAAALVGYVNQVFGESPYLSRGAGEWTQTVEKEVTWIESKLADSRSVLLLALVDGVIAGDFDLHPIGGALRLAHRAGIRIINAAWAATAESMAAACTALKPDYRLTDFSELLPLIHSL